MKQFIQLENGKPKRWPIAANAVWPYAPEGTGFPLDCTDADLTEFGFETFELTEPPTFDPAKQKAVEGTPVKAKDGWSQTWSVVDLTADEIEARKPQPDPRIAKLQAAGFTDAQITAILSIT